EKSGHMLSEQEDMHGLVLDWLEQRFPGGSLEGAQAQATTEATSKAQATAASATAARDGRTEQADRTEQTTDARFMFTELEGNAASDALASVDMSQTPVAKLTWRQLHDRYRAIAQGLHDLGLRPGDRVSMLVPPGNDLTAILYAVLRAGGIAVVADAGLGPQ